MKTAIVHPTSGWILTHMARRLEQANPEQYSAIPYNMFIRQDRFFYDQFKVVFYMDVQNCWTSALGDILPKITHVGFFTHLDKNSPTSFRPHWQGLDGVVHMAQRYCDIFVSNGFYNRQQMTVIPFNDACDTFSLSPIKVAVVQRGGFEGKGDGFAQQVIGKLGEAGLADNFIFQFKGTGWRDMGSFDNVIINIDEDHTSYKEIYDWADFIWIPSLWEGGPMSFMEAYACGKPIISAKVGWVETFITNRDFLFDPGDVDGCVSLFKNKWRECKERRDRISHINYKECSKTLDRFILSLIGW